MNPFQKKLTAGGVPLSRGRFETLQINVGRKCNQVCTHCHVDAGPHRTEMMDEATAHKVGAWIREHRPKIVDITGGAPEISEFFNYFVETARSVGAHVIDRNNLTIIETKSYAYLPEYLAKHQVEVVASLPCYLEENVDEQRGNGVFQKSISALRKLNAAGYGTTLPLTLVYNPIGAKLPPEQSQLEADYKRELEARYGIVFTRLFAVTNLPIARFAVDLREHGQWDYYMELLANSFNPATVDGLMCRSTINIGYEGEVFDCDFNQMLKMQQRADGQPLYLWDITPESMAQQAILTANHCFGCTAGHGSSCTGSLEPSEQVAAI
ncbi:arsenosugar biosynthesis radical SAM protein ArsS [Verrucomicrobiaceae bacterium R5-34]|uniref:Arsenosugar biosynthesis radical SAM protein ArsS n=1 Tax=Oceaniferula flava TaxID=2800421 RepID=A0AAE2SB10_9BACT|nr:arsenosugar biosynthesis radical SAM (seleno)protein ArsS [Oceaniferula flavus]MBK1829456.1 arsenosugar biosynthesis radical SAM protein ArsS [Verrucomicrobiaceae bacterium R5-34]MBK1853682.1 arsenosugar biosynthesis radical SAM protein ArsS [Oceaniferula flavus]MBM1134988.1 arsenosugar biosynthesis radical SAM protein ArsS [Oceaniferula flavus]